MKLPEVRIYDACVIGAGASGLVCASELAKRGYDVLLIEKNKKSGRKLYATGNGRCNVANAVISASAYYYDRFAQEVVSEGAVSQLLSYLEQLGIPLVEKNGYYYPQSLQASSVVWALTDAVKLQNVPVLCEEEVLHAARTEEGGFLLTLTDKKIRCNRLVLSMGSPAAQELGAAREERLYDIMNDLSLPYEEFTPALCPLVTNEDVSPLAGVRVKARLRLGLAMDQPSSEGKLTETGELQITDYGISGIAVFNISTLAEVGEEIAIDLLPLWNQEEEVLRFLKAQNPERRLFAACNGMLHEKLCSFFLTKCFGEESLKKKLAAFTDEELLLLIRTLKDWRLRITGKRADMAQANRGGVLTHILDPDSMQVKRDRRIAVTGEMCHVTGRCGGYNLMFALISGIRAGQRI